jgi:hypothetical protein
VIFFALIVCHFILHNLKQPQMITANEAHKILTLSQESKKYYKRDDIEALTELINQLAKIELGNLSDDFFYTNSTTN